MYNQNQQGNPYQPIPPNMFNPQSGNNPGGYGFPNNPQMNLFNPGYFRGSQPNQRIEQQNQNKLSEDEYYSGGLGENARSGFVGKVYMLLSLQLLLTTLIGYLAYNSTGFRETFANPVMVAIVSVSLLAVTIVMACCTDFFRKHALILFAIFTVLMALLVSIAIAGFSSKDVLMAVGVTLAMTVALTIYAWKSDSDMTGCGVYLMIVGLVMLIFGIVAIFWHDPIVHLVYSCLSAMLFSIYLVYDTQLILGQKKYSYSLDDAYMAAIQLYTDIIQLFLNLLQIISYFNRS